jgi:hypothetical protein
MFPRFRIHAIEGAEFPCGAYSAVFIEKPGASIQSADFVEVELMNVEAVSTSRVFCELPGYVGCPQERFIVEYDGDAIPGQLNVELPSMGAVLPGEARGFEGVFGSMK